MFSSLVSCLRPNDIVVSLYHQDLHLEASAYLPSMNAPDILNWRGERQQKKKKVGSSSPACDPLHRICLICSGRSTNGSCNVSNQAKRQWLGGEITRISNYR